MKIYKQTEVDAIFSMLETFDIDFSIQKAMPNHPLVIRAQVYQWRDGSLHDDPQDLALNIPVQKE